MAAFPVVEHRRQAMGTSVHGLTCSASADMEYTMDLGALPEAAYVWVKLLDCKKNEEKKTNGKATGNVYLWLWSQGLPGWERDEDVDFMIRRLGLLFYNIYIILQLY